MANPETTSVADLERELAFAERLKQITNMIHAAETLDDILVGLPDEVQGLFDAERLTIYAVDYERKELYSKYLDPAALADVREIRVSIDGDASLAGFVAQNRVIVNVADVYDQDELSAISPTLQFDKSWDEKTGFRTKQLLTIPILSKTNVLTGVIQLVNLRSGDHFSKDDENRLHELAKTLGIALYNRYQWVAISSRPQRRSKFGMLTAQGKLTPLALDTAVTEAAREGRPVEYVLMEKHGVQKKDIGRSLGEHYECPYFEYSDDIAVPKDLIRDINPNYLKTNFWVPLSADEETVEILIDDPHDFQKLQDIRRVFPGRKVKCVVGFRDDIYKVIHFAGESRPGEGEMGEIIDELVEEERERERETPTVEIDDEAVDESSSAIVRLANQIIAEAVRKRASDIHIEPNSNRTETLVRIRVDGVCHELLKVPPGYRRALTSRLKIMARLDIAERRRPQDGKIRTKVGGQEIELRVATIPTAGIDNEDVVMRILASGEPIPVEKLAMTERNLAEFRTILAKPYGLILCVGPTGSGKTTTLHAGLGALNVTGRKIWTAEDPVEISQLGLRQVQVQPKIGFTFAAAMRSFLRADPDVIMVGEMRDEETAETAIEASLTGHLVMSTLHTNTAAETITRLLEMGLDPFSFADSLLGVLGQRLVRTICSKCKEEYRPDQAEFDALVRMYGEAAFQDLGVRFDSNFRLYRGKGCSDCNDTGYRGRAGIHELLIASDEIKRLVRTRSAVADIHQQGVTEGMTTLVQDGILKTLRGMTDPKQVFAVAAR